MPKKRKGKRKSAPKTGGGIIGQLQAIGIKNSPAKAGKRKGNENNPWGLKPIL